MNCLWFYLLSCALSLERRNIEEINDDEMKIKCFVVIDFFYILAVVHHDSSSQRNSLLAIFIFLSLAMSIIFVKILRTWNKNLIRFLNKCKRYSKVYKNKCSCDIRLYLLNFLQFFIQKLTQLFLLNQILGWW